MHQRRSAYRRFKRTHTRSKSRRYLDILLTLLFFISIFAVVSVFSSKPDTQQPLTGKPRIIDGDTLSINSIRIRLHGIDAPEMDQYCRKDGKDYACGASSRRALQDYVSNAAIRCDALGTDKYKRVLARCYLGDNDINSYMVSQGWAVAYGNYKAEEAAARASGRGLWAGEFERPGEWRKNKTAESDGAQELFTQLTEVIADWVSYIKTKISASLSL